mmetsp:Transcript_68944/g.114568  ORF Transcript_68944/g.114568 Transcript_68944/m.114568 type:complete len:153 (+) Transcript_68944:139-597(+)
MEGALASGARLLTIEGYVGEAEKVDEAHDGTATLSAVRPTAAAPSATAAARGAIMASLLNVAVLRPPPVRLPKWTLVGSAVGAVAAAAADAAGGGTDAGGGTPMATVVGATGPRLPPRLHPQAAGRASKLHPSLELEQCPLKPESARLSSSL